MTDFEADIRAVLERHGLELAEVRERIETYRVTDRTGAVRTQGVTRAQAVELAERLAEDHGVAPITVERVLHWSFTQREVVMTLSFGAVTA